MAVEVLAVAGVLVHPVGRREPHLRREQHHG
jgi:hypothetical protein